MKKFLKIVGKIGMSAVVFLGMIILEIIVCPLAILYYLFGLPCEACSDIWEETI